MATKEELRQRWTDLSELRGFTAQLRGYELERLFLDLARAERFACRPSYRAVGEQMLE